MGFEYNLKKFLALGITVFALAACGDKNEGSTNVTSRGMGPRTALANSMNYNGAGSTSQMQGIVRSGASNQNGFQQAAVDFVSTDVQPQYVGYVSATGQNNSGILFGGRVGLASGSLRNVGGGQVPITSNSTFQIQVVDYTPQYPNSPLIPPFVFNHAEGYISGNMAQITFSDSYGSVSLEGTIDSTSGRFVGQMTFDNNVNIDPNQPGHAGNLGDFIIPICSFFVCN
jgi:hypothetical protein